MKRLKLSEIKLGIRKRETIVDEELLQSIKQFGLINPINVTRRGRFYYLLDGLQRLLCLKKLKKRTVLAIVHENVNQPEYMKSKIRTELTLEQTKLMIRKLVERKLIKITELAAISGISVSKIRRML